MSADAIAPFYWRAAAQRNTDTQRQSDALGQRDVYTATQRNSDLHSYGFTERDADTHTDRFGELQANYHCNRDANLDAGNLRALER